MTQEEKQLLLQDLCARLPYGVKIECGTDYDFQHDITDTCKLLSVNIDNELCELQTLDKNRYVYNESLDTIKPYLRPMESMTEEEKAYRMKLIKDIKHGANIDKLEDFYHSHYLDYRGLIEKGLALEAHEDMYKLK